VARTGDGIPGMGGAQMSKLCVDCRHIREVRDDCAGGRICYRPVGGRSPVDGKTLLLLKPCAWERVDPTGCGPDGKFWEERT
jgi:hypothetical protein